MAINYYLVLGVPSDADLSQIKRAFRSLTHQFHPDRAGEEGHDKFLLIKEAYDALSDPVERERHNRELARHQSPPHPPRPMRPRPLDLFGSFQHYAPSFDDLFNILLQNFTSRHRPKSQRPRELNVEILLTPAEATAGGHLPMTVPVFTPCPNCQGAGQTGFFVCPECAGHGIFENSAPIDVLIPRQVRDGTTIPVSLRHLGIANLYLNIHIRVSA